MDAKTQHSTNSEKYKIQNQSFFSCKKLKKEIKYKLKNKALLTDWTLMYRDWFFLLQFGEKKELLKMKIAIDRISKKNRIKQQY